MVDLGVAENRNAVDVEALNNGEVVRGAVGQIAVVIVRLQDIKQDVGVRLSFAAVWSSGLQTGVGIDEQGHRSIPIAAHQQVCIVPRTTNDFTISMHLTYQILWINLGVFIVNANAILAIGVEALSYFRDITQTHSPYIRVAFIHSTVIEVGVKAVVEIPIDAVAIFMPYHIGNQRCRIASSALVVKIYTLTIVEGIAFTFDIDVSG